MKLSSFGLLFILAVSLMVGCGLGSDPDRVGGEPVDMSGVEQKQTEVIQNVGQNGLDLSYASDLFMGAILVHPQRAIEGQTLTAENLAALLAGVAGGTKVPIQECGRLTLLLPASPMTGGGQAASGEPVMSLLAIMEFEQPIDFTAAFDGTELEFEVAELNGESVYRCLEPALIAFQPSAQSVVFGPEKIISSLVGVQKPRLGRLAELMGELDLDADMVGVLNGAAFQSLAQSMGPGAQSGQAGGEIPSECEFRIDFSGEELGRLNVEASDAEAAKEMQSSLQEAISGFRFLAPMMASSIAQNAPTAGRRTIEQFVKDLFRDVAVVSEGKQVSVRLSRPNSFQPAINVFAQMILLEERRAERVRRLEDLAEAMAAYDAEHQHYPADSHATGDTNQPLLSWRVHLLPQLGYTDLYEQFALDEPWDSPRNAALLEKIPAEFQVAGSNQEGDATYTSIARLVGAPTAFPTPFQQVTRAQIEDGLTKTIMFVEVGDAEAIPWTRPGDVSYDDPEKLPILGDPNESFFLVVLFDGSGLRLQRALDVELLRALITPAGEEQFDLNKLLGRPDPSGTRGQGRGGFPF